MDAISITRIYNLLANAMGKETAENLTNLIENKINQELESKLQMVATKQDIAESKTETLKWMFIFWISQVGATIGFLVLYVNK